MFSIRAWAIESKRCAVPIHIQRPQDNITLHQERNECHKANGESW